ncbi:hypothetical protein CCR75_007842 [Bremia lactucae]|uniref:Uncharacterized protein n=1 Tax=Bremia lactucae TaxID=4779 RepID=A0A976FJ00_BRELC|nr:hypothetical protein CCR75_007840 [Bremia lactucae]TDH67461.1 hypothetical protein CCR75_007842 [Bremia lactucae]
MTFEGADYCRKVYLSLALLANLKVTDGYVRSIYAGSTVVPTTSFTISAGFLISYDSEDHSAERAWLIL